MNRTFLIGLISIFFFQCASVQSTLEKWEKKSNDDYWYGISIINKKGQEDIRKIATQSAVQEIASQIKIQIQNEFVRTVTEKDFEITDEMVQTLHTQVENNLEDIEIVDSKDFKNSYMILARLSKKKYYSSVKKKRKNATNLAVEYLSKVNSPSSKGFIYLSNARNAIKPYTEYPIYVNYNGKEQNLYTLIEFKIEDMISRINISSDKNSFKIKSLIDRDNMLTIICQDKENKSSIPHIPLFLKINNQINYCTTSIDGECTFYIKNEFLSKQATQSLYIGIDSEKLYGRLTDFNKFSIKTDIVIEPIKIRLNIKETNLGKKIEHSYIEPIIKNFLVKEFNVQFTGNSSDSDLLININASTYSDGKDANEYGLYKVFGDATIDIKFSSEEESLIKLSVKKQAVDFNSFKNAGHNSLDKISTMILNETLPELISILQQS